MNRRALALISAVVLSIIAGAWWLSTEEVLAPTPAIPAEEVRPAPASPPVAAPPSPPAIVSAPVPEPALADAGPLAEVEIEVFKGAERLVGVRVGLEGPGGRVSRPTDIMGFARFVLQPGSWRITDPTRPNAPFIPYDGGSRADWEAAFERAWSTPIEVVAPLTRFRLTLPTVHKVKGRVVDLKREPVIGAEVRWSSAEVAGVSWKTETDAWGKFELETTAESIEVQAQLGDARSLKRSVGVSTEITLVIEPWAQLSVTVFGPGIGVAGVQVRQNTELVAQGSTDRPIWVPLGPINLLARRNAKGRVYSGKASITVKGGAENSAEITLTPSPPLRGRVIDSGGRPIGGLRVEARELNVALASLDAGWPLSAVTTTNHVGEFSLAPGLTRSIDPVYELTVVGLWKEAHRVLLGLDNDPLDIVVVPVPQ